MKIVLIFLSMTIIYSTSIAQTTFKRIDFTNRRTHLPTHNYLCMFHFDDGMGRGDSIEVQIEGQVIDSLYISDSVIISILHKSSLEAMYSLKEKTSYEVNHGEKSILIKDDNDNSLYIIWNFIGQNVYGAKRSSKLILTYDLQGKLVKKTLAD